MKESRIRTYLGITLQSLLLGFGLYFFGRILRSNLYNPLIASLEQTAPALHEALRYLGHICFLIPLLLYFLWVEEECHFLKYFRLSLKRKDLLWVVIGLALGFAMNSLAIIAAIRHGDIDMVWGGFDGGMLLLLFIAIAFQSSVEEFHFRLWLQNRILNRAPLVWAVCGSAVAFALVHILNSGISVIALINLFLAGVVFSLVYYYSGSIWAACAQHAAWNFTQNCVFGLPNSGNPAVLTMMQPSFTRESFFYDPEFGVEGTPMVVIIQLIVIAILIVLIRRKTGAEAKNAADAKTGANAKPEN